MRVPVSSLVVTLALLLPGQGWAAKPAGEATAEVRARGAARKLPAASVQELLAPISLAAKQGLPAESVADKVLEGLAKGADPARIARAAEDVRARLEGADEALRAAGVELSGEERRAELDRLSLSIQTSDRQSVVDLARQARGAQAGILVDATRQLSPLRARGAGSEAVPALGALARAGMGTELTRLPSLLDEYRAEGGQDLAAFFDEVRSRAEAGEKLDDLIDPFDDRADPLRRRLVKGKAAPGGSQAAPGKGKKASDEPSLEKPGRSGSAPGLDPESRGRREKDCSLKKNSSACK